MLAHLILAAGLLRAPDTGSVYQAVMIRAAPGRLVELIDRLKARMPVYDAAGERRPVLFRHAQGDQWDLMVLAPIGNLASFWGPERAARWRAAVGKTGFDEAGLGDLLDQLISWREELWVEGPPPAALDSAVKVAGYFHLEIFQALAGKRDSLRRERLMEDDFSRRIGRPGNLLFTRVAGAGWDLFTVGFYRDLPHYAEPSGRSPEVEDQAARAAGFASRGDIGPYLRRFLASHHATLGPIVR
jgi:hypothetical protein